MAGRFAAERPAGGLQMLAASSVGGVDAAVRHVLWYLVLQTSTDRCAQLVLHPLRNVQPVQLVVQEMGESEAELQCVTDGAAAAFSTRWSLSMVDLDAPARTALQ